MKHLWILILLFPALAQAETLSWNANSEIDLAGYNVYSRPATQSDYGAPLATVGKVTSYTFNSTVPTFLAVTAYDLTGLESQKSDEVLWLPPTVDALAMRDLETSLSELKALLDQLTGRLATVEHAQALDAQQLAAIKYEVCTLKTWSTVRDALRKAYGGCL